MAQMIQCDAHNLEHRADWLVTNLDNGDSLGYCNAGYMELMAGFVHAADQAEADQANAEALARLETAKAPPPADDQEAALDRIEQELAQGLIDLGMDPKEAGAIAHRNRPGLAPVTPATGDPSELGNLAPGEDPAGDAAPTQPSKRVKRGQSLKARRHRQRVAARADKAGAAATAEKGPDDDEDDDEPEATSGDTAPA